MPDSVPPAYPFIGMIRLWYYLQRCTRDASIIQPLPHLKLSHRGGCGELVHSPCTQKGSVNGATVSKYETSLNKTWVYCRDNWPGCKCRVYKSDFWLMEKGYDNVFHQSLFEPIPCLLCHACKNARLHNKTVYGWVWKMNSGLSQTKGRSCPTVCQNNPHCENKIFLQTMVTFKFVCVKLIILTYYMSYHIPIAMYAANQWIFLTRCYNVFQLCVVGLGGPVPLCWHLCVPGQSTFRVLIALHVLTEKSSLTRTDT